MKDIAIIRGMSTKEGDHGRATFNLRTGYTQQGPIHYPTLGSIVAKELERGDSELPSFVSISPYRGFNPAAFGPGFLGPQYAPLVVGERAVIDPSVNAESGLSVENLHAPAGVKASRVDDRLNILDALTRDFVGQHPGIAPPSHQDAYQRAVRLMRSAAAKAFELKEEPAALRDAYGRTPFGQGCLLARRLVERGVPFIEVTLSGVASSGSFGWDTHMQNFESVQKLARCSTRPGRRSWTTFAPAGCWTRR